MVYSICISQATATLVAGILAFVAALTTLIINLILKHKEKVRQYAVTISQERSAWINQTRELVSLLYAFCKSKNSKLSKAEIFEFERLRANLLLRISPSGYIEKWNKIRQTCKEHSNRVNEHNKYIADEELNKILNSNYDTICNNIDYIRELFTYICKGEWDRVRAEAGEDKSVRKSINKIAADFGSDAQKEALKDLVKNYNIK